MALFQSKVEHTSNGVLLSIWEPATRTGDRVKPFLFKVNFLCESLAEASDRLDEFTEFNVDHFQES